MNIFKIILLSILLLLTITADGQKKHGCIEGDCYDGIGKYIFPNGDIYDGSWESGHVDGWGDLYYANGDNHSGKWFENFKDGFGILTKKDGTIIKGTWMRGVLISQELGVSWKLYDDRKGEFVSFDCMKLIDPFTLQSNFVRKFKVECELNRDPRGPFVLRYHDKVSNEDFYFSGDINHDGEYINGTIYGFDNNDILHEVFEATLEKGIVVSIERIKPSNKNRIALGSFIFAGFVGQVSENITTLEAIGCALAFNIGNYIEDSTIASIMAVTLNNLFEKDSDGEEITKEIIKLEIHDELKKSGIENTAEIDNIISFIKCLINEKSRF